MPAACEFAVVLYRRQHTFTHAAYQNRDLGTEMLQENRLNEVEQFLEQAQQLLPNDATICNGWGEFKGGARSATRGGYATANSLCI